VSFEIRRAREDDFEPWLDLFEAVAAEGRWIGAEAPLDRKRFTDGFAASLANDDVAMFMADAGTEIVGQLRVELLRYRVAELGMMVADGWRGRGVGSALLDDAIAWARDKGAHKVALQMWPHNDRARALYEKFGFEVEGRLRRHYPRRNGELWDAVVMGLLLDPPPAPPPHATGGHGLREP